MFQRLIGDKERVKLSGFNNLTKVLSFNLYDFCITLNDKQRQEYVAYINEKYSAENIAEICRKVCEIIEAQVLSISNQNYDPVGASSLVLMSDIKGGGNIYCSGSQATTQTAMHLDKSHIAVHTYPDASDPEGICSFRVDFDVATCGEITPLDAINYLFNSFESDVVYVDYVVRGYTRLENGSKIYNDQYFNSIQDFITDEIKDSFLYKSDLNMPRDNIWQSKFMIKSSGPKRFLMNEKDVNHPDIDKKMALLYDEMKQVFHMIH